ncbi:MAG: helix-turn-helix domain-containing protein [Melioribacteraceae bacterium]
MKKEHVKLQEADFEYLKGLLSKGTLKVRKQNRARGLIELHKGKTYSEVSSLLNISYPTVLSWASKYKSDGLIFLDDKPRSGRPIGLSGEDRAKITAIACSEPPEGYARWSLRLLADKLVELEIVETISFKQVGNILKKMNCNLIEKDNGVSEK